MCVSVCLVCLCLPGRHSCMVSPNRVFWQILPLSCPGEGVWLSPHPAEGRGSAPIVGGMGNTPEVLLNASNEP